MGRGQGFGEHTRGTHAVGDAAALLMETALAQQMPLILPILPPGNNLNLGVGELRGRVPGDLQVSPQCDGLVMALPCTPDEAAAIMRWLYDWQKQRLIGAEAQHEQG